MVFSSTVFLFLFLPVLLGAYLLVPRALRNPLLLAASLLFYAWGEGLFLCLMLTSILMNWSLGLAIGRSSSPRVRGWSLFAAVCLNLGLLGWFKYANFFVANASALSETFGRDVFTWESVHLPIGISFFTFQALSYVIDVYRGETEHQPSLTKLALYISLFPQLIAGPIVRYRDINRQLGERELRLDEFSSGAQRFTVGLAKKLLIANTVALPADRIFALPTSELTFGLAWLGIMCYGLQIYFDFSGYSDMAIGLGHMFGFHFLENFNYPYISRSMTEFWRRWHISLSSWFRDFLYIPLGGNRYGRLRTLANLVTVFFLCGLWHGASWTFVIWGLYHGILLVAERLLRNRILAIWTPLQHLYVVVAFTVGWVLFRAETLSQAGSFLAAMAGFAEGEGIVYTPALFLTPTVAIALAIGAVGSLPILPTVSDAWAKRCEQGGTITALAHASFRVVATVTLFLICAVQLSAATHNPFIYFRF